MIDTLRNRDRDRFWHLRAAMMAAVVIGWACAAGRVRATEVIFVSNPANFRIDKFAMDGSSLGSIAVPNYGPYGLAVSSQGILYVSNLNNQIVRFDSAGNALDPNPVSPFVSGLSSPYFLTIDSSDRIYASSYGGNSIKVYDTSGTLLRTISENVSQPYGVAVGGNGNVYVANYGTNNVTIYNSAGAYQSQFGLPFGTNPRGLAVSADNFVYVANYYDHTILKYDVAGNLQATISAALDDPTGLVFDAGGNLYAVNEANATVSKYDTAGVHVPGFAPTGLSGPYGIAIGVPEPSTYAMAVLACSVLGSCEIRRRRRERAGNARRIR